MKKCNKTGVYAGVAFGISQMNVFIIYAVVFYTGALFVEKGDIEMLDMFDSLFCIMFAAFSVGQASMYIPDVGTSYIAARSIFAIIDLPSEA